MEEKENFSLDRRLFVGNIGYRIYLHLTKDGTSISTWGMTSEKELKDFFLKFGKVNRIHLPKDHYRKLPRGFAFVTFSTAEEAQMCLQAEDERLILQGRLLRVHMAEQSKRVNTRRYENNNNQDQQMLESKSTDFTDLGTAKKMPVFNVNLPDELWEKIFSFLPLRDRIRIERVCHRWKKLALRLWKRQKSLDFYNTFRRFESLTDKMLNSILKRCGSILRSLDLSSSPRLLTDYSMQIINKYCPSLEKLDLSGVDATNISIRDLTQDLHTLKWVRLQRCLYIGEKGLWWLLHNNKDLEYIDVTGNIKLTGQCFHMIGPKVKIMVLKECKKLCDVGIEKIKDRCVDLEELYITDCCLLTSKSILTITQSFSHLRILHCGGSLHDVTEEMWIQLQNLKLLEELNLSQNCGLTDEAVVAIATGCYNLRVLDLSGCHRCLTDEGIQSLSLLGNLTKLNISYLYQITDISLNRISTTGKLQQLIVRACSDITDSGVEDIVFNCPQIQLIDVSGCIQITNKLIQTVISLTHDNSHHLLLNVGGTCVVNEELPPLPTSLSVSLQDYSSYYLRPDKHLLLPEPEEEEDDDDVKEDTPWYGKPQVSGVMVAAGYEENIWQEEDCDDQFDDITDEFLDNDDCLAVERWEMS